ncbi:GNAT family N-acetyltransferase [Paenibacillus tepidiphilus]|uniref:GNAT family N-acetyltransferase n=1 Tax=Paenibacillus tepidiphilus TaxID=2608683 RepID=UPI0012386CA8|nr:GNAT family N-acetyltransferase [Paenibacillus tepidiphilus]
MIELLTERLRIREYHARDLPALQTMLAEPLTMSYWPQPFNRVQSEDWLQQRCFAHYPSGYGRLAVELKDTRQLIGDAGLLKQDFAGESENDLGYIIHSDYWGEGYGYEAARAVMEYGWEKLELTRICANMPEAHTASRHVAEKLGMKLEKQFANPRNRGILTCLYAIHKV